MSSTFEEGARTVSRAGGETTPRLATCARCGQTKYAPEHDEASASGTAHEFTAAWAERVIGQWPIKTTDAEFMAATVPATHADDATLRALAEAALPLWSFQAVEGSESDPLIAFLGDASPVRILALLTRLASLTRAVAVYESRDRYDREDQKRLGEWVQANLNHHAGLSWSEGIAREFTSLTAERDDAQRLYVDACGERDALAMHSPGDRLREAVTAYLAAKDAYENRDTRALADAWWAADAALRSTLSPTEDA